MRRLALLLLVVGAVVLIGGRLLGGDDAPDPGIDLPALIRPPADGTQGRPPDELAAFLEFVAQDTSDYWADVFAEAGREYRAPGLQIFQAGANSACGATDGSVGPFYCPVDETIYLPLEFLRRLDVSLGAPGDFAQAYVVAHEMAHHIQTLVGVTQQIDPSSPADSVRFELQADCLAGVWGASTAERGLLETGDLEEGLNAAAAVGDEVLQARAGLPVDPESFTHGTAEQRASWLLRGFETADPGQCNTFAGSA